MSMSITAKQRQALEFIKAYMAESAGNAPSYEEIGAAIGVASKSGIHRLIVGLEGRGHIARLPHRRRCLRVIDANPLAAVSTEALVEELERRGIAA